MQKSPIPCTVSIAPRGKSWVDGRLVDGEHGSVCCPVSGPREDVKVGVACVTTPAPAGQLVAPPHSDDLAIDAFAAALKAKMAKQRAKGYSGWDDRSQCPSERLQHLLRLHVAKGDPVDVGNFAMMLFHRGASTV